MPASHQRTPNKYIHVAQYVQPKCRVRPLVAVRTTYTSVVVAAPCAGLAPASAPVRRDVRSCVRTDEPPNRMRSWHTFINITLIIFRLSFGCEAGTRHGHYFWKPKKVLLKALLCDFLNHLINRELRNDLFTTRNRHFRMPITVLSQRETSHLANLLETGCMQE